MLRPPNKFSTAGKDGKFFAALNKIIDCLNSLTPVSNPTSKIAFGPRGTAKKFSVKAGAPCTGGTALLYENVTTVPNWRDPSCEGYTTPIPPEPIPILGSDTISPEECNAVNQSFLPPTLVINEYSLVDPPAVIDFRLRKHRGFKVVYALKAWHGMRSFTEPCSAAGPFLQTKYRRIKRVVTYTDPGFTCSDGTPGDDPQTKETDCEVNRYTGEVDCDCEDNLICDYAIGLFGVTHCGVDAENGWTGGADGGALVHDWNDLLNGTEAPQIGYALTKELSATRIYIKLENPAVPGGGIKIELEVTLSAPYTAADVHSDAMALLAYWDLSDDMQMPWRTDAPAYLATPAPHYVAQYGPSYGPLMSYNERGPVSPDGFTCDDEPETPRADVVLGTPNPAGYEPHWDSSHVNKSFRDSGGNAEFCWRDDSYGAFSPFRHATQWTPDNWDNQIVNGAVAQYNSPLFTARGCTANDPALEAGSLVVSKYAEIYLFEFPGHNDARPCGPVDQATIDPDSINCATNPDGDLRWPTAPEECSAIAQKRGDYSIKFWYYKPLKKVAEPSKSELFEMEILKTDADVCGVMTFNKCVATAVFFQEAEPTGKYSGARWVGTSSIALRDEFVGGRYMGECKIWQLDQVMVDPLWKQPKISCDDPDNPGELDPAACVPYEENRDCLNGACNDYVSQQDDGDGQVPACEPGARIAWDHPICPEQL